MNRQRLSKPISNRTRSCLVCCAVILASPFNSTAFSSELLTPHVAQYEVRISVLGGELNSRLENVDGSYVAISRVEPKGFARLLVRGSIEERSVFTIADGLVQSSKYSSSDTLTKHGQDIDMEFDWVQGTVTGHTSEGPLAMAATDGAIDRASLQYALMLDLMNDRLRDEYVLQDVDDVKRLIVSVEGEKFVDVPYGRISVIGITHSTTESSRKTTLWCAPSLGYLPVVIEQYRKGKLGGRVVLSSYSKLEAGQN